MSTLFYDKNDVMTLVGVAQTKALAIIRELRDDLAKTKMPGHEAYFSKPPAGRIQKRYFCERYNLDLAECEQTLQKTRPAQESA